MVDGSLESFHRTIDFTKFVWACLGVSKSLHTVADERKFKIDTL